MNLKDIGKDPLEIGMEVIINPQQDRTRAQRIKGKVVEILTGNKTHPHGILVRIDSGTVGRVKEIVSCSGFTAPTTESPEAQQSVKDSQPDIENLLNQENQFVEYKSSSLWSTNLSKDEISKSNSYEVKKYGRNASKQIIAKTLAGFLNTEGGTLVIGIKENKDSQEDEIIGIEGELKKLKDPCLDGYRRMIVESIVKPFFPKSIFNHFVNYIKIDFVEVTDRIICTLTVERGDHKVFLKFGGEECFYIRVDATTREISGEQIVDYCMKRF